MATKKELTGSVQEKNSKYYIALNTYIDGKRKPTWIPTGLSSDLPTNLIQAEDILNGYINEYSVNGALHFTPKKNKMFIDYLNMWLNNIVVEQTTWDTYEIYVRRHIIPYFEPLKLRVDQVKPRHIKSYYDYKTKFGRLDGKGGLSRKTICKHAGILKVALDEAVIQEDLQVNPATCVPVPKSLISPKKDRVFLSAQQANELLDAADGHQLKALIYIALYYGLRRSELVGLKWDAIDMDNNTMEIKYTVTQVRQVVEKDRTKTLRSRAKYVLLKDVKEVLKLVQAETDEYRHALGNSFIESGFVFIKPSGERYNPDSVTRQFKALLRKQNLPDMRLHDLRYSCASVLFEKGWDMKRIQEWMRHSSSNMTSYYTNLTDSVKSIMADDLEGTFTYGHTCVEADLNEGSESSVELNTEDISKQPIINVYCRDTLYQEVWENPVSQVANGYGISGRMLKKLCDKMNIPVPPIGYWSSYRAGMPVEKPPLPPYGGITILRGRRTYRSNSEKV